MLRDTATAMSQLTADPPVSGFECKEVYRKVAEGWSDG